MCQIMLWSSREGSTQMCFIYFTEQLKSIESWTILSFSNAQTITNEITNIVVFIRFAQFSVVLIAVCHILHIVWLCRRPVFGAEKGENILASKGILDTTQCDSVCSSRLSHPIQKVFASTFLLFLKC